MPTSREKTVVKTSVIGILTNVLLAGFKAAVGLLSNSIAIISDAVNNLSDALSSMVTIVGTKLAGKAPDKKHPYGYGRLEYMTALAVSAIVLYAGLTAFIESVKKILSPEEVEYSFVTLTVIAVGIVVKFVLGAYVKKKGRLVHSDALVASGYDAFNDALLSIAVFVSAIVYVLFTVNVEAYVSVVLSIFIIKAGVDLVKSSVNNMLETRVEGKLSKAIKREILKEPEIAGAFDLVLNNYGPDKYLGSVHIEVPDKMTVAEVDKISRRVSKRVMDKYGVLLHTIGVYSVNTHDKQVVKIREDIERMVFAHKGVIQMHGFYLDAREKTISFDIIIDFAMKNREEIYREIYDEVRAKYPEYKLTVELDVDASD